MRAPGVFARFGARLRGLAPGLVLGLVPILLLASCGFHLRGASTGPDHPPALSGRWSIRPHAGRIGPEILRELSLWRDVELVPDAVPDADPDAAVREGSSRTGRAGSHIRVLGADRIKFAAPWSGTDPVRRHELRLAVSYRVERGDMATDPMIARASLFRRIPDEVVSDRVEGLEPLWDELYKEAARKIALRLRTLDEGDFRRKLADPIPGLEDLSAVTLDRDLSLPENAVDR